MVRVKSYALRTGENGDYVSLELEGDLEMVQSSNTGRFYATTRRCSISSTFDEITARKMVGKELAGEIVRVQCGQYDYTNPETGEIIQLAHRYDYRPEGYKQKEAVPFEMA